MATPTTFPLFSSLPLELRRKIWRSAFPPPRTISLSPSPTPLEIISSLPPITLFVCHESRVETLHHYTLIHRSEFTGRRQLSSPSGNHYLNQPICIAPKFDMISFHADDMVSPGKGRCKMNEWLNFLDQKDSRILRSTKRVEITGLDWENSLYLLLKFQAGLRGLKDNDEEYEGQGGVERWEELNFGVILRLGALRWVGCGYKHQEFMGNFEEQLERFLGWHAGEVWGDKGVPIVERMR